MKKDIGIFVRRCPPMIALIALNRDVTLLSPGALSKITPFTWDWEIILKMNYICEVNNTLRLKKQKERYDQGKK